MRYTFDDNVVSDLHKDAYGFRPSSTWWAQWKGMSADDKQAEWEAMCIELDRTIERERAAAEAATARWNAHIAQLMSTNGIDRATALRWDMDANGVDGDVGCYCYQQGIGFDHEEDILRELAQAA